MNLQETKETILLWLKSCQTAHQLDLITEAIYNFIILRFTGKESDYDIEVAKLELGKEWQLQAVTIAATKLMEEPVPTLFVYEEGLGALAD